MLKAVSLHFKNRPKFALYSFFDNFIGLLHLQKYFALAGVMFFSVDYSKASIFVVWSACTITCVSTDLAIQGSAEVSSSGKTL